MADSPARSLIKPVTWMLIVGGILGLIASYILTLDEFKLLQNPSFRPNCDLNPVISCGSVMMSSQAKAFGFPNPWIGLAAFAILLATGMALLAGGKFKRWFWWGLQAGVTAGTVFALWLLVESIYRIGALCPYCLLVDVVVFSLVWYVTLYNIDAGNIRLPAFLRRPAAFARRHHLDILVLWFLIVIALILKHFWYYYGQHI